MTEHSGNDRGQGPRRGGERSSFGGPRGGRDSHSKPPRQGGGRPAKAGQDRDAQNRDNSNRDSSNRDSSNRDNRNRDNPSRGPWKPREAGASGYRGNDGERRGRPDSAGSARPSRDGDRFPRRTDDRRTDDRRADDRRADDRRAAPRGDDRRRDDRPSDDAQRSGGWKPRNGEGPRGGGQERRPFTRDANGYGRPAGNRSDTNRSDAHRGSAGRGGATDRGAAPRGERGEDRRFPDRGFAGGDDRSGRDERPPREHSRREHSSADRPDRGSRDGQRSTPWKSRTEQTSDSREGRSFNRDANGYRRAEPDDRRSSAPRVERRDAPRTERRDDRGPREDRRTDAPVRVHNPRDLRSANRPDRERSPEIDEGVTGAELDRVTRAQLRTLESKNGEWVAKHLVMAGRLIDDDPELSFQHALAASRRGGRLAAVREAVGLTAYAAGHYAEALREFRTYRRISGSNVHLPLMADSERGLGRADRALDLARTEEAAQLDSAGQVELAIVVSGARADLGQKDAALAALEITQLDKNRAFSYSPRLFRAYADALEAVGRGAEAGSWRSQAALADQALGGDEEPEIIDLDDDDDEDFDDAPNELFGDELPEDELPEDFGSAPGSSEK